MDVYGLKNCEKCRKAVNELIGKGHAARLVDIREAPLSEGQIARFLDAFGDELVNRRSTTWRGLPEAERGTNPSALLAAHPALMKRPVVDAGGELYLGWDAEVKSALL